MLLRRWPIPDQTSCGLFVGNAEKRFGKAHEDDTLCGAEPVLVKKDVEPAHRAPLSPDMLDEPSRTPIDSLGYRAREPGIRKQCAFKGQPCIYCLVRPSMNQGDHVFARQLFPVSERDNLPKVPCCDQCNNDKSRLEHYLVTVLPFGAQHADSLSNLKTMVPPRLVKNQRLNRELRDGQERILTRIFHVNFGVGPFEL